MSTTLNASDVAHAIGAETDLPSELSFSGVHTDTRCEMQGGLFLALTGDRFDGHEFLGHAVRAGAVAAVVRKGTESVPGLILLEVDNTLAAYGQIARLRRRSIPGPVVAITGQNGKTSTKEMVAAVLSTKWQVHKTSSNDNNLIGVPKSILSAPEGTDALVIEAGANSPGEIAKHREVIEPTVAIVTNAGAGHLEGFGSIANVVKEKLSLTDRVALAIVGVTPPELANGARAREATSVVTAGIEGADVTPDEVVLLEDGRPELLLGEHRFVLDARGRHQAGNAMFAWALAKKLKLDLALAADALTKLSIPGGRTELSSLGGIAVLNDGYNANPESFKAVIELASQLRLGRRLIFVAGTMKELGQHSAEFHSAVAEQLEDLAPDLLALVGDFVPAWESVPRRCSSEVIKAADAESMGQLLAQRLSPGDLLVLKGSRGAALETILPAIALPSTPN